MPQNNQVCIHSNNKEYEILQADKIPHFSHDSNFVVNPDSLTGKVWDADSGPLYWKLDTDTPDILGINQELELFKRVFLQIGMETPLVIRRRRRQTADAAIVVTFTHEDPFFKERPSVLAYAYGPANGIGGDITFNDNHIWTLDGDPITAYDAYEKGLIEGFDNPTNKLRTYDAQHTGTHEGGHAVGMPHIPEDPNAMLYPYYNGQRIFQQKDLALLHKLYGSSNLNHKIKEYLLTKYFRRGVA